jgi:MFS family permease
MSPEPVTAATRWSMVAVTLVVTASTFAFINAGAFLIPALESQRGTPLGQSGLLTAMPSVGMVTTLVAWGYAVDRFGERVVLAVGSALTAAAAYAAASVDSLVVIGAFLFLGGMAAASCLPAGGRLVAGWFPPHQRGLAMGIRQTAQPLGIAMDALAIPHLAEHHPPAGLLFPALACAVSAVAIVAVVRDPPRKPRALADVTELVNPYSGSAVLYRIHAVSALMTLPQYVTVTFMLHWLVKGMGWSVSSAGTLVMVTQLLGAASRIAAGRWSDRVGSRMRPVRTIALATGVGMMALALSDRLNSPVTVAIMVAVSVITVMDNGLEATAITESAGQYWSGRALGIQNTTQRVMALAGQPAFGALIGVAGYPLAFALCGLFPLAAAPMVPTGLVPPGLEDRAKAHALGHMRG